MPLQQERERFLWITGFRCGPCCVILDRRRAILIIVAFATTITGYLLGYCHLLYSLHGVMHGNQALGSDAL